MFKVFEPLTKSWTNEYSEDKIIKNFNKEEGPELQSSVQQTCLLMHPWTPGEPGK